MTQEEIQKRAQEIRAAQSDLAEKLNSLAIELNNLMDECKHPNVITGNWDGYYYCQDCGAIN
ncbi:MAG: hypothetical protein HZA35_04110 [Parcubacteria group bacterium]|nr:hypothetical protein [Parcubacteria group bacterium]